jgi:glycosyltransferase involved in cell wall biosynthesis
VIVGEGDLRPEHEAQTAKLGLAQRVVFPGRVVEAELPDYYRLADVTVLPSITMGEAFGLVLVESLACATPVIASNLPGVRTVVSDGQDGFLVEPNSPPDLAEKLGTLLSLTASERLAMGARGRAKVIERYTWEKVTAQLESVYQQALAVVAAQ